MIEKFSISTQESKKRERYDIEQGLSDYLKEPYEKPEVTPELIDSFDDNESEDPIRKKDFEKYVEEFIRSNAEFIIPLLTLHEEDHSILIDKLGITNKDIALLGANYFIREQDGKKTIFKSNEDYPDGIQMSSTDVTGIDLISLKYLKGKIRIDTQREVGGSKQNPHRYYFEPQNRYLAVNDFGMRKWDDDSKTMVSGDVTNLHPFVSSVREQMYRIKGNLDAVLQFNELWQEIFEANKELPYEEKEKILNRAKKDAVLEKLEQFKYNPQDFEIILRADSFVKVQYQLHFKYEQIARKFGFLSGNPAKDYENYEKNKSKLKRVLRVPSIEERDPSSSVNYFLSDFYDRPIINTGSTSEIDNFINSVQSGVRDILANRAAYDDPECSECYKRFRSQRGENSPYFYPDHQIYDFIKTVGVEKAQKVLDSDDRGVSNQMTGLTVLVDDLKYDISSFNEEKLKKQLHQARVLVESLLWGYLNDREREDEKTSIPVWESRNLFREGKRMYWLAKQVWINNPERREGDRFYYENIDWSLYDLSSEDISEKVLERHLSTHINLIVSLLNVGNKNFHQYGHEEDNQSKSATLGLIIKSLEKGSDIRGAALANDKQRYLNGVIDGDIKNDLEFAIADWPQEWRDVVSEEEIGIYYEYASDYIILDPNGLTKYASWRSSEDGREWDSFFKEKPTKKSDLDFRICLSGQTEEIRGWYRGAAEHVGNSAMQNYLLRFNTTRDTNGRISNWHDVLLWSPNIQKLEAKDARSILSSIETMDDNQEFTQLLPRYDKDNDPLIENGPVTSLRELKKRILAIESNIDLSKFTPEVIEIVSAPGFNLSALESMSNRPDFKDLVEGKLDTNQPFEPFSRKFAGRSLTEALREGLGSQKQKIRGTAKDPKGLFFALNQLVKDRTVGEKKMTTLDLLNSVPTDLEEQVMDILREQGVNIGPMVEAQIHAKSDPEGWVCGNYTDCCMPFGASNNNDYMFNPSTQYFTIKYNGRIVAQSVVVDSKNNETGEDVVILDNIEVANNYKNMSSLFASVYQTFWTEYTSKPVKVGTGYSDLIPPGGQLEINHYKPKTSLSYSDARGSQIYDMPKIRNIESMDKIVTFANLSERDAELISVMEAEAYPEGMAQGKAHITDILQKQRELEVPGAASSFVVRQGREPAGYILVLPEQSEVNSDEQAAHIYDMVVMPKFRGTSIVRKMMERVLDIAQSYNVPIEAEARASTSYALLMNQRVRKWFESKGYFLTKNERLPEYLAGEDFYFVRFENKAEV